ncbi:MAG: hypothetical protein LBJ10_03675 [Clostridiales bacterium]|nr:hypothetical protein [Clostridiales bacterium]
MGALIPLFALSIPIVAIALSYRQKANDSKVRSLELQREILELEIEKSRNELRALEEENRKYDNEISEISGKQRSRA